MATKIKARRYISSRFIELLAARHSKDVFVPECKDGPTQSVSNYLRMDAWVMNKSWANPCVTGYEIKVSRSDFIGDNKWPAYLPLCNQFYFVAPKGLIDPSELSPDAGLLQVAGDGSGTRLLTKKKAPYRQVAIPEDIYRYVLMCRVKVAPEDPLQTPQQIWRNWLERKKEDRYLGYEVSKAIREKAQEIERENSNLKAQMQTYDSLLRLLETFGVSPDSWGAYRDLQSRLEAARKVFDPPLLNAMRSVQRNLEAALVEADRLEAEASPEMSLGIQNVESLDVFGSESNLT